jgi:hypothetical protein
MKNYFITQKGKGSKDAKLFALPLWLFFFAPLREVFVLFFTLNKNRKLSKASTSSA